MPQLITWPDEIYAVDADYMRPRLAAIHVIRSGDQVALIDTAHNESVPRVLEALAELGLGAESVRYVMLTHIHLDHAGGAGAYMQVCPNAQLVVHPRGARHMADPSKLWAGTCEVYGEASAVARYGRIIPVPAERIIEATDGLVIDLNGREIEVADTPGHARHHVCYFDRRTRGWFTGDVFGLSYRELDRDGKAFVFPSTTPVQFDPEAMHASIDRIMAAEPTAVYPTHFSRITDLPRLAADLRRLLDAHVAIAQHAADAPDHRHQIVRASLTALLREEAQRQRWPVTDAELFEIFEVDLELNAQGLEVWLDQQKAA